MLFNGHLAPRILIDYSLPPGSSSLHSLRRTGAKFLCSMNADDSRRLGSSLSDYVYLANGAKRPVATLVRFTTIRRFPGYCFTNNSTAEDKPGDIGETILSPAGEHF